MEIIIKILSLILFIIGLICFIFIVIIEFKINKLDKDIIESTESLIGKFLMLDTLYTTLMCGTIRKILIFYRFFGYYLNKSE